MAVYIQGGEPPKVTPLPERIRLYMQKVDPAISGSGGHNAAFKAACALVNGFGLDLEQAYPFFLEYNERCQPPWSERELKHKLESAEKASHEKPRGHLLDGARFSTLDKVLPRTKPKEAEPGALKREFSEVPLPPSLDDGFRKLLMAAFTENEGVCLSDAYGPNNEGKCVPNQGETCTQKRWLERIAKKPINAIYRKPGGAFMRINPMAFGNEGTDSSVTSFRHVLVEADGESKEKQYGAFVQSELPISVIIDSGGRSVHAWVRVDASNHAEYIERAKTVYRFFALDLDSKNKNPSRYSRVPDIKRVLFGMDGEETQSRQTLLAVSIGLPWDEWERKHGSESPKTEPQADELDDPGEWIIPADNYGVTINQAANRLFTRIAEGNQLFTRDGNVVAVDADAKITDVEGQAFRGIIEEHFSVKKFKKGKRGLLKAMAICPIDISSAMLKSQARFLLPPIQRVLQCPVIDKNGNICGQGYHGHLNGGTFITGGEVEAVELNEAINAIMDVFSEFDWQEEADKLRAIALLFSPAIAMGELINGRVPLDVAEADDSQSGKTYRQQIVAAFYNEVMAALSKRTGGVGSTDESVSEALLAGKPFIQLDNFRGSLDSQILEMAITSDKARCRALRTSAEVLTKGVIFMLSSNGALLTPDLANRSCFTRIRKRKSHSFKVYPGGLDLLSYIRQKQGYYLGCVFAVLQDWIQQGCPSVQETRHDFKAWAGALTWITSEHFRADSGVTMLDGHEAIQGRTTNEFAGALRKIGIEISKKEQLGDAFTVEQLVEVIVDMGLRIPGVNDDKRTDVDTMARQLKRQLRRFIDDTNYGKDGEANSVELDQFTIHAEQDWDRNRNPFYYYRFEAKQ